MALIGALADLHITMVLYLWCKALQALPNWLIAGRFCVNCGYFDFANRKVVSKAIGACLSARKRALFAL